MNEIENLYTIIKESVVSIENPRFYETERGFQGALVSEINKRYQSSLKIVEQEYQKSLMSHNLNIRPDILIHQPFDRKVMRSRKEGNKVVMELKLRGNQSECLSDYDNLSNMCKYLDYELAVFINISSEYTYIERYLGEYKDRIRSFGVTLGPTGGVLHE